MQMPTPAPASPKLSGASLTVRRICLSGANAHAKSLAAAVNSRVGPVDPNELQGERGSESGEGKMMAADLPNHAQPLAPDLKCFTWLKRARNEGVANV